MKNPLEQRRAGVLLHPTSLPGESGALGVEGRRFIDFLADGGFSVWQMLPLGPTHAEQSPYQCLSVYAGSEALIDLGDLLESGYLDESDVAGSRQRALRKAGIALARTADVAEQIELAAFFDEHADWLDDYALYRAIRESTGGKPWYEWPEPLRDREAGALGQFRRSHRETVEQVRLEQYLFYRQWHALRAYAHTRGVQLFGDVPIYVAHDSADVWLNRDLFSVDPHGHLETVAGVPPDYFSATGQRWGNPLYRWGRLADTGYSWWVERMRTQLALFDIVRLDHFRGFEKFWEIPAGAETAVEGHWEEGPGEALFDRLRDEFGKLPLVAEDLGIITPEVEALRLRYGLPGMKILQFAFDGGTDNPYLPANHEPCSVVYTGTHDNDTTLGWYEGLDSEERSRVDAMLDVESRGMPGAMIHAALASDARLAMIPMQDLLALGSEHRMNVPGTVEGNWQWRFSSSQVTAGLSAEMLSLVQRYSRYCPEHA